MPVFDRRSSLLAILITCSVVLGCTEAPTPMKTLRMGYQHDLVSLDPHGQNDGVTRSVLSTVYQSLVRLESGAMVGPELAKSWTTPADTVWRFVLRENVTFHDGRALTADDVVWSILRARFDPESRFSAFLGPITDVKRINGDLHGVEIVTEGPFPLLLPRLSTVAIVPEGFDPSLPIGSGPYRWIRGSLEGPIHLQRWEGYWSAKPDFNTVSIEIVDSSEQLKSMIREKSLDVMASVSTEFLLDHGLGDEWRVEELPIASTTILGINVTHPVLSDQRVREAIDLVVNRDELVEELTVKGLVEPALSVVSADVFGFSPPPHGRRDDLERARKLLQQAGVAPGTTIHLDHSGVYDSVAQRLIQTISRVGLRIEGRRHQYEESYRRLGAAENELFLFSWSFTFADASNFLDAVVHTKSPDGVLGRLNGARFSDEAVDRWIVEASSEARSKRRLELLRWSLARVDRAFVYLPLFHRSRFAIVRSHLILDTNSRLWTRPQDVRAMF